MPTLNRCAAGAPARWIALGPPLTYAAEALMGLADIYFDAGADRKAVAYAERAVSAAPGNQHYRIKPGDAYFKVLRYRDALAQYERAAKAGSSKAQSRVAKVRETLGGSPEPDHEPHWLSSDQGCGP